MLHRFGVNYVPSRNWYQNVTSNRSESLRGTLRHAWITDDLRSIPVGHLNSKACTRLKMVD